MNAFDLHIAYVCWGDDGKRRPILVISQEDNIVQAYAITSQYCNKSENVRSHLYSINDWAVAGLAKPSYIDVGTTIDIPIVFVETSSIGRLSDNDKVQLGTFIERRSQ